MEWEDYLVGSTPLLFKLEKYFDTARKLIILHAILWYVYASVLILSHFLFIIVLVESTHTFIPTRQRQFPLLHAYDICHNRHRIRHVCCRSTICMCFIHSNDSNCKFSTVKLKVALKEKIDTCPDSILLVLFSIFRKINCLDRAYIMNEKR